MFPALLDEKRDEETIDVIHGTVDGCHLVTLLPQQTQNASRLRLSTRLITVVQRGIRSRSVGGRANWRSFH